MPLSKIRNYESQLTIGRLNPISALILAAPVYIAFQFFLRPFLFPADTAPPQPDIVYRIATIPNVLLEGFVVPCCLLPAVARLSRFWIAATLLVLCLTVGPFVELAYSQLWFRVFKWAFPPIPFSQLWFSAVETSFVGTLCLGGAIVILILNNTTRELAPLPSESRLRSYLAFVLAMLLSALIVIATKMVLSYNGEIFTEAFNIPVIFSLLPASSLLIGLALVPFFRLSQGSLNFRNYLLAGVIILAVTDAWIIARQLNIFLLGAISQEVLWLSCLHLGFSVIGLFSYALMLAATRSNVT